LVIIVLVGAELSTIANHSNPEPNPLGFACTKVGFVKRDDGPVYLTVTPFPSSTNSGVNVIVFVAVPDAAAAAVNVGGNTGTRRLVPTEEYVICIL